VITDDDLERIYKEVQRDSHAAAIRAIYELGQKDPATPPPETEEEAPAT